MNKNSTIPILYPGGGYGTFIEWCLNYFSGNDVISNPIGDNGNSHKFKGNHLLNMSGWRTYLEDDNYFPFVRLHPKVFKNESVINSIEEVLNSVDKALITTTSNKSTLLIINNKFDKVWDHGWLVENSAALQNQIAKWGTSDLSSMAVWEIREFLSFYIFKQHNAETEPDLVNNYSNPKLKKIDISELVTNFNYTIKELLDWCNLNQKRSDFDQVYNNWIAHQVHVKKDEIVDKILDSVLTNTQLDWSSANLSTVDEAFIQMQLRDLHNLELLCYNLNQFPTNTTDLKKFLVTNA